MSREVMQMALDALEELNMKRSGLESLNHEIDALKAALAQPEPEQVCLMVIKGEISYKSTAEDQSFGMWCPVNYDCNHSLPDGTKFYTFQPKREWVGLTDEETVDLWEQSRCALPKYRTFKSLIEAKLKDKNKCLKN